MVGRADGSGLRAHKQIEPSRPKSLGSRSWIWWFRASLGTRKRIARLH